MRKFKSKKDKKRQRHIRVRAKMFGTKERPRLCVFRSHKHIYAQLINDEQGKTIVSASDFNLPKKRLTKEEAGKKMGKLEINKFKKVSLAYQVGKLVAKGAAEHKIKEVVFDKGGNKYHGRVEALAQGARDNGLKF